MSMSDGQYKPEVNKRVKKAKHILKIDSKKKVVFYYYKL